MTDVRFCQHPEGCRNLATKGWYCDEHRPSKAKRSAANPAKGEIFEIGKNTLVRKPKKRPR